MTLIDKAEALLPCPFCGGGAVISQRGSDERHGYVSTWTVACLNCDAKQSATDTRDGNGWSNAKEGETKSRAIAAWNRRAALAPTDAAQAREAGDKWVCPFLMEDGCDQPQGLCYCLRDSRHKPQDAAILRAMEGRDG